MMKHGLEGDWETPLDSNGSGGNNCVEVLRLPNGFFAVGDSKDPEGPPQIYGPGEWGAFVKSAKDGQFDVR